MLTKKFPYPPKDGESVAVHALSSALSKLGVEITLLSMNTSKHFVDLEHVREQVGQYREVHTSFVDNKIRVGAAIRNLLSDKSYHIERFDYEDYRQTLKQVLTQSPFDIVMLESIYLTPYVDTIRACSTAKVVVRLHNIEYEIWQRIAVGTKNPIKKIYLNLQVRRLQQFEELHFTKADGLIAFTERDMEKVPASDRVARLVAPISIDTSLVTTSRLDYGRQSVAFLGSLDWQPNIEGLIWFVESVWPKVIQQVPEAELHIAGRSPVSAVLDLKGAGITVHGEVPDAIEYVSEHPISVVPLLSGSGMRVKILEAMALSRCIVSTTVGAEGIDDSALYIADTAEGMASKLIRALQSQEERRRLGSMARKMCETKYDSQQNTLSVLQFLHSIIQKR